MTIKRKYPDIYDDTKALDQKKIDAANRERKRLYLACRYLLRQLFRLGTDQTLSLDPASFPADSSVPNAEDDEVLLASVVGQCVMAGFTDPSFGKLERATPGKSDIFLNGGEDPTKQGTDHGYGTEPDPSRPDDPANPQIVFRVLIVPEFVERLNDAVKRFNSNKVLFTQTWVQLREKGVGKVNGTPTDTIINTKQLAEVAQRLIVANVSPYDPHIVIRVLNAITQSLGGAFDGMPSVADIEPPDLEGVAPVEIVQDNVLAVRLIYYSAQLEEMKLHAVVEKLVEHFQTGMLPISRGSASDKIYTWIKASADRLNEAERRGIYGRVLGLAQGATNEGTPNREFADIWYRFLATVSLKYREVFSAERAEVSDEQIHKAARDLAVNMSLHGYGIAYPAAIEMQTIVNEAFAILDEQAVQMAYGVRDRWQLVDRVSALYLGGVVNGVKYRTIAGAGEKIVRWLAERAAILASSSSAGLKLLDYSVRPPAPTAAFKEIADLAERWLAVTGTPDESVRKSSDPVDLQQQYTVPMLGQSAGMPSAVQDALNQVGGGGMIPNLPVIPQA